MQNEIQLREVVLKRENTLLKNVYSIMAVGLLLTAFISYFTSRSSFMLNLIFSNPIIPIVLIVAQFGLVLSLSARIAKLERNTALTLFLVYSALNGLSLSSIFIVYAQTTIYKAFFSAAFMFVGVSLYASVTKRNIAAWSRYLMMGLFGLLGASLLNIFFHSSAMDFMISIFGVVLFLGLTIYDTKKILSMNNEYGSVMNEDELVKIAVLGALNLYLDFINIFMYLLRIFARADD